VVTLNEAKALLKVDDDLIIAVYDYWLNKRLRLVRFCFSYLVLEMLNEARKFVLQILLNFKFGFRVYSIRLVIYALCGIYRTSCIVRESGAGDELKNGYRNIRSW